MNQKIPFHELSARIALATGIGAESAETFVKNFFDLLSEALTSGESVRIKGLGAFNVVETDGERNIEFIPDKEITDVINAPFAMFEAVSLSDDLSDEMLVEVDKESQADSNAEIQSESQPEQVISTTEVSNDTIAVPDSNSPEQTIETAAQPAEVIAETGIENEIADPQAEEPANKQEPSNPETAVSAPEHKDAEAESTQPQSTEESNAPVVVTNEPRVSTSDKSEQALAEEAKPDEMQAENAVISTDGPITPTETAPVESASLPPVPPVPVVTEQPIVPPPGPAAQPPVLTSTPSETPSPVTHVDATPTHPIRPVAELEEDEEEYVTPQQQPKSGGGNFWIGLIVGLIVGLALGACGVYLAIDKLFPTMHQSSVFNDSESDEIDALFDIINSDTVPAPAETAPADSVPAAAAASELVTATEQAPAEQPQVAETTPEAPTKQVALTDTVRRGYLIHDMAKKHFGSKDFWVYIYEENKTKIGNPNNMQVGVVLVIPPADKYGISANDPESLRKARNKAGEVLRKFSK